MRSRTLALGLIVLAVGAAATGAPPPAGVAVERVDVGLALDRAGIRAGDELLGFRRAAAPPANPERAAGTFTSPFDVAVAELEQAPRGAVTIEVRRGGEVREVVVPPGFWGGFTRPRLDAAAAATLDEGLRLLRRGDPAAAAAALAALADREATAGRLQDSVWIGLRVAEEFGAVKRWDEALAALAKASETARAARLDAALVQVLLRTGSTAERKGDLPAAEQAFAAASEAAGAGTLLRAECLNRLAIVVRTRSDLARARALLLAVLALREQAAPDSFEVANTANSLAIEAFTRGDMAASQQYQERALAIRERLAPEGPDTAASLHNLGVVMRNRGRLDEAERLYRRALAMQRKLNPTGPEVARVLNSLGVLADGRGDLAEAERSYRDALAIRETLQPDSLAVAGTLTNLGIVAFERGDVAIAEEYHQRALAIRTRIAPGGLDVANSHNELGNIALYRGQLDRALEAYTSDLRIREKAGAAGPNLAVSLRNVGDVQLHRGAYADAEASFAQALAIDEKVAPGGLASADDLTFLGNVARGRGDDARAGELHAQALAIRERIAPGSLRVAESCVALGAVRAALGSRGEAAALFERAIAINGSLAPGTRREADALRALAMLRRDEGRRRDAVALLMRAIAAVEAQRGRLGGGREAAEAFSANYAACYRDLVELQVSLGQPEAAFATLERFRARVLLAMLAERDIDFSRDAPAELLTEQRRIAAALRQAQDAAGGLDPATQRAEVAAAEARLVELRAGRDAVAARIRQASPRLAALQEPQPLDLAGVRRSLDADTLFVSYCVGDRATFAFAVLGKSFRAVTVQRGRRDLATAVRDYRTLLADPASAPAEVDDQARALGRALVDPFASWLGKARRIVVCADGPLHQLPFASLRLADGRWLVERLPVLAAVSATVLAEGRRAGSARPVGTVAAFGDPAYPAAPERVRDATVRAALRGVPLDPLPATRAEVEAVGALYPGKARVFTGAEAREDQVKALGRDVAIVHLACHGLLDTRLPLESGLALAIPERAAPGQDNGFLQAWEVLESVRLDADLVTLSACETGLGTEMGGEGLVGLTRAFLYAGARSVVSTLWSVADESTAELMRTFYAGLAAGRSKAEALQAAQLELLRRGGKERGGTAHPFFWAGFTLSGEWR